MHEEQSITHEQFDTMAVDTIFHPRMRKAVVDFLIQHEQPIPVSKLLDWGQYDPTYGYYQNDVVMQNDYQTTPEKFPQLCKTIGETIWKKLVEEREHPHMLVAGDGTGIFTAQSIRAVPKDLRNSIDLTMVDRTQHLLNIQRDMIQGSSKGEVHRIGYLPADNIHTECNDIIQYLEQNPDARYDLIQHNELLDALPLRFYKKNSDKQIQELYVTYRDNQLVFEYGEPEHTNATDWFMENFSDTIQSNIRVYQPDAAYLTNLQLHALNPGGKLVMVDYYTRGPTKYTDIPVLGWDLQAKVDGIPPNGIRDHEKYFKEGLASAVQAIGMVDVTLLVDRTPIETILRHEGKVETTNQWTYLLSKQKTLTDFAKTFAQVGWHTNFSVIEFTKNGGEPTREIPPQQ